MRNLTVSDLMKVNFHEFNASIVNTTVRLLVDHTYYYMRSKTNLGHRMRSHPISWESVFIEIAMQVLWTRLCAIYRWPYILHAIENNRRSSYAISSELIGISFHRNRKASIVNTTVCHLPLTIFMRSKKIVDHRMRSHPIS